MCSEFVRSTTSGVAHRFLAEIPIAVVDLETTGLYPGGDRIVELAVVRIEPNEEPKLVLDTLLNPQRPMSATEIHGITDHDVADAPTFQEVAGNLLAAMNGCVFASYNVYFDSKFVQVQLAQLGIRSFPPCLCLMYLRPLLGVGSRCSLADACRQHGVEQKIPHYASTDALVSARLWQIYSTTFGSLGIKTFGDLAQRKAYKFTSSFSRRLLDSAICSTIRSTSHLKSRALLPIETVASSTVIDRESVMREYWDALTAVLADWELTPDEFKYLVAKRASLNIAPDELRWLHARFFAGILADACQDRAITVGEATALYKISTALRQLGWTPGDPLTMS